MTNINMPRKIDEDIGYLSSIFGGGVLEVFGIYQLPLNLGNLFFNLYWFCKR